MVDKWSMRYAIYMYIYNLHAVLIDIITSFRKLILRYVDAFADDIAYFVVKYYLL